MIIAMMILTWIVLMNITANEPANYYGYKSVVKSWLFIVILWGGYFYYLFYK